MKFKKLHVFLLTLVFGGAINSYTLISANFSNESIHEWALNSLLVAAIVGFIVTKHLKNRGKLH
jgi:uncharacterized membrane protein YdjX (TVP38/TMEM64 family)